jgi:phosphoglycerate dehydrogenase-like enzyme
MAAGIARVLDHRGLPVAVDVVTDTSTDPPGVDGIEVLLANTFPAGLLGRCPRLRWLHLTGTGTDHVAAGEPRPDLVVTTSATVPAVAVAEFAWMGLLALAKDAVRLVQGQHQRAWAPADARLVAGSHLVLVGLGRIGTEIARRAAGFGVRVTAVTRSGTPSPLVDRVVSAAELAEACAGADHLVLAVPATAETRHLVDARVLAALPRQAVVVNVGRAATLDVAALVAALRGGCLRAALLDVHDTEPVPPDSPLWSVPRLWLTPHTAYRFPGEEGAVAELFASNLAAFLTGQPLRNRVECEVVV